jgi:hypothetical protein
MTEPALLSDGDARVFERRDSALLREAGLRPDRRGGAKRSERDE